MRANSSSFFVTPLSTSNVTTGFVILTTAMGKDLNLCFE